VTGSIRPSKVNQNPQPQQEYPLSYDTYANDDSKSDRGTSGSVGTFYRVRYRARRGKRRDAHVVLHDDYCEDLADAKLHREVVIELHAAEIVGDVQIFRVIEEEIPT
jgi:hypothetical protein